ncbi:MAG: nucleoside-diphosphate kinase [Candidatus Diapherotrites archaeon]|nr:nucleoside-diphosphate kinase [Candidatus Diapherotrites archaeon]
MERTLVIIKPDALNRSIVGEIISRFEKKGLKIVAMKMQRLQEEKLREHYGKHKDKDFFNDLIKYMSSIPSVLLVLEGKEAVDVVRKMTGNTVGRKAEPGTIRGDFSMSVQVNIVHASDSAEEAKREVRRFFSEEEIQHYSKLDFDWVYSSDEKK